jgi:hypothetical protein
MAHLEALPQTRIGQAPAAPTPILPQSRTALSPAMLMVRRHRLPVTTRKRAVVIPYITDAPIDIAEGCPLFPSVGNTADGYQGAVFHSYVGAACAIGSLRHRLGMGGLRDHRSGDQERKKRTQKDLQADTDVPAPRATEILGARKDEAQSPQPKSNFHQNLRSVPGACLHRSTIAASETAAIDSETTQCCLNYESGKLYSARSLPSRLAAKAIK